MRKRHWWFVAGVGIVAAAVVIGLPVWRDVHRNDEVVLVPPDRRFTVAFETHRYELSWPGGGCTIRHDGRVRFQVGREQWTELRLYDEELWIEQLYYTLYAGDPVFIYEVTDLEWGLSRAVRLNGETGAKVWDIEFSGFNLGQGRREGNDLYLVALGFVGRLDLRIGQFAWKDDALYEELSIYRFDAVEISRDMVSFRGRSERNADRPERSILLTYDKKTGRRLKTVESEVDEGSDPSR